MPATTTMTVIVGTRQIAMTKPLPRLLRSAHAYSGHRDRSIGATPSTTGRTKGVPKSSGTPSRAALCRSGPLSHLDPVDQDLALPGLHRVEGLLVQPVVRRRDPGHLVRVDAAE